VIDLKRIFFAAMSLFLFLFFNQAPAAGAETVALDRYLEMVWAGNYNLQAAMRSLEAAYYGVLASVAPQRPSVAVSGTASYVSDQVIQDVHNRNTRTYDAAVALTHRIDISGSCTLDERQQILSYEIERARLDANINTLAASAEQAYWSAVLARENIALQKDVLRQRQENNRVTEEKYKQQLVPKLDLIRSEAQVVAAESLVTEAAAQYRNLLAAMANLAGGVEVVPVEEPLSVPRFNVAANPAKALLLRPDVRAARLTLERSQILKKLRAKGMAPTLTASVQWTAWADPWNASTPQDGEIGASLRLSIPLLDGNATKYNVLNADRLAQAAEATLQAVETSMNAELATAINNWELAAALEKDKARQVERSDEELRITELMYNEGMGAQIDLINAQTENQRVRTDYLNAVKGMYVALAELRNVVGDYSPAEDGAWKEAVIRYGKGNPVKTTATSAPKKNPQDPKEGKKRE
jgi:outer membrane protein TolC